MNCIENELKPGIHSWITLASWLAFGLFFSLQPPARALSLPEPAGAAPVDVPAAEAGFYWHHFVDEPPATDRPQAVFVGGDFNLWSHTANPMHPDGAGHFVADVKLAEGPYAYDFFVGGAWVNDGASHSEADLEEAKGISGHNSAVFVGPDGRSLTAAEPGKITVAGLHHVPGNIRYFDPVSAGEVRIAFGAQAGNLSGAAVYSRIGPDWRRDVLYPAETRTGITYYAGVVLSQSPELTYFFELKDGNMTGYYAGGKYFTTLARARKHAWQGAMQPAFNTPEWAQQAVWYQIFPERFRNGDTANDPANVTPWTARWLRPGTDGGRGGRRGLNRRRYGGDIQGIQEELPYLRSLGVTCLYLNPIFKSPSLHKYDTSDYRHVDDHFGIASDTAELAGETADPATWKWTQSDKLFLDFVAEAHRQGFKVIIDGVFNHSGTNFFAFQDLLHNGRHSSYADWYTVTNWDPLTWISFGDSRNGDMPEFKKDPLAGMTAGPKDFIFNIARRWLAPDGDPARGVDGFRLDYAQNVPRVFWVDYRNFVKSTKPDALITGEIWTPAFSYLYGDAWDATMQYPFAQALQAFFVDAQPAAIPASVCAQRLQLLTTLYPFQVSLDQMNLLDSHDTERWASRFVNADRPAAFTGGANHRRAGYNSSKPTDQEWARMKQSVAVQMTYVGSPMVYYGDEAGMWGGTDPDDRQPMVWKDLEPYADPEVMFKQDLFDHYVRLIALHRRLAALQSGFVHTVLADDAHKILVYSRDLGEEHVYVLVNRSDEACSIELPIGRADQETRLIDWLDSTQAVVRYTPEAATDRPQIEPISGAVPTVVTRNGMASVNLKPWGAMILAPANAK